MQKKEEADSILYLVLREIGMGLFNAKAVYLGVRIPTAEDAWDKNTAARETGDSRFFTEVYRRVLQDCQVNPTATLVSLQSDAGLHDGIFTPHTKRQSKSACQATLRDSMAAD